MIKILCKPAPMLARLAAHSEMAPLFSGGTRRAGCETTVLAGRIVDHVWGSSRFGGAGMGSKRVELFAVIRFDWQRNRMSIRSLARKYDVHWRTVRQAIASPLPPDRGWTGGLALVG